MKKGGGGRVHHIKEIATSKKRKGIKNMAEARMKIP